VLLEPNRRKSNLMWNRSFILGSLKNWRRTVYSTCIYNSTGLDSKVSEEIASENAEDCPCRQRQKLESLDYIFAVGSIFIQIFVVGSERCMLSALECISAVQGYRKGICFLLVINSNFGSSSHRFWDTVTYWLKIANFPTPLSFNPLARSEPYRISGWTFITKNRFPCAIRRWFRDPSLRCRTQC